MNPIIEAKKREIITLCRQYGVSMLDFYGWITALTTPKWPGTQRRREYHNR